MQDLNKWSLMDVDYGYCTKCDVYEVVNMYSKDWHCNCQKCAGESLYNKMNLCSSCLKEYINANL